ncbi:MAG: ribonuclease D [Desulfobacteraceae bacterium 4572_130]|nr:MAG: ribonuclease D [Desulfobacteraceae bacterium 4572_130]
MFENTIINTQNQLENKCKNLKNEKKIAVDLEADSMYHFKEKICVIQIADSRGPFIIDPLIINNLSFLEPILEDSKITKIFHGADFDIRSFYRDYNIKINNLFDTEIASRFLGIKERSLAALLKKYFNISIDKTLQKTDWSKRPLSKKMILYSLTDVKYLIELSEILKKELINIKRLEWAKEEFELQTRVRYENNNTPLFLKFKGAGKMNRKSLGILENLLKMRQKIAKQKNRPLFKIISSNSIAKLAYEKPISITQLKKIKALSPIEIKIYGNACIKAILMGLEIKDENLPLYPQKKKPEFNPNVSGRIKALKKMRLEKSKETGIESGFLINNNLIIAIANKFPLNKEELIKIKGMKNWQKQILSNNIIETMKKCD